jgi:hypothetical protein
MNKKIDQSAFSAEQILLLHDLENKHSLINQRITQILKAIAHKKNKILDRTQAQTQFRSQIANETSIAGDFFSVNENIHHNTTYGQIEQILSAIEYNATNMNVLCINISLVSEFQKSSKIEFFVQELHSFIEHILFSCDEIKKNLINIKATQNRTKELITPNHSSKSSIKEKITTAHEHEQLFSEIILSLSAIKHHLESNELILKQLKNN